MEGSSEASREDERRRVLEMLERGQISAAEADELLVALEGRSTGNEFQPSGASQPLVQRPPSISGRAAVVVGLARALAKTIAGLSIALGKVVGALARLWGRVQIQSRPHNK
jgi:hypothetical protein